MKYTYRLYELFHAAFIRVVFSDVPVQLNDFIISEGHLLQVKQIAHDLDEIGHVKETKLFAINIQSNKENKPDEEVKRD